MNRPLKGRNTDIKLVKWFLISNLCCQFIYMPRTTIASQNLSFALKLPVENCVFSVHFTCSHGDIVGHEIS